MCVNACNIIELCMLPLIIASNTGSLYYFIDQQTMPPSIKKSFLKTLYNSIMNNSNEINAPVEKILK